jgi:hypothetical protein
MGGIFAFGLGAGGGSEVSLGGGTKLSKFSFPSCPITTDPNGSVSLISSNK